MLQLHNMSNRSSDIGTAAPRQQAPSQQPAMLLNCRATICFMSPMRRATFSHLINSPLSSSRALGYIDSRVLSR